MDTSFRPAVVPGLRHVFSTSAKRDPWHTKRRKAQRGRPPRVIAGEVEHRTTSRRGRLKQLMRLRAQANYHRIATIEATLALNGWTYRDFRRAIDRKDKLQLTLMVAWLKQKLPKFLGT